jgi:TIGR03009 family protein
MTRRFGVLTGPGLWAVAGLLWAAAALGQTPSEPYQGPAVQSGSAVQPYQPVRPDQPVEPQYPTIQRRPAAQSLPVQQEPAPARTGSPDDRGIAYPPRPQQVLPGAAPPPNPAQAPVPFVLSPEEQRQLDQVLAAWEQRNKEVKRFECKFTRWQYDGVFGNGSQPKFTDLGNLAYAAPDKGMYRIDGERAEQWICDGRSIYQYKFPERKVVEYPLPPELQGKAISDGPLPFVFGTESQKLKQRYFLRLITPREAQGEIWLEARPRFQRDAADFKKAELILKASGMMPFAIQLYSPNGTDRTVYQFEKVVVNRRPLPFEPDPFRASVPFGWKKEVEHPPGPAQAARGQADGRR